MTIDELMNRHPLPWRIREDSPGFSLVDADGFLVDDTRPEVHGICDAMQELVRLRDKLNQADDVARLAAEKIRECVRLEDELATLRARSAELESYVIRLRGAPKRLADALYTEHRRHEINDHDAGVNDGVANICDALRDGTCDAAIYGDGGAL